MKVKELIERLQRVDQEATVSLCGSNDVALYTGEEGYVLLDDSEYIETEFEDPAHSIY